MGFVAVGLIWLVLDVGCVCCSGIDGCCRRGFVDFVWWVLCGLVWV